MKGLLIKDLCILKNQAKFYGGLLVFAFFVMFIYENPFFVVPYLTMILGLISVTSINYDEVDQGFSFLFTMPFRRKEYVLEKYVFAFLTTAGAAVVAFGLSAIGLFLRKQTGDVKEFALITLCTLFAILIYVMLMLPVQLKFGAERARIALVVMMAALGAIIFVAAKLFPKGSVQLERIIRWIDALGGVGMTVGMIAIWAVIAVISYMISVNVMQKKEF